MEIAAHSQLEKDETYLSTRQAAELLHTSPAHLANLRFRGEGVPFVKFGRKVLYPSSLIRKHMEKHIHSPVTLEGEGENGDS